MSLTSPIHVVFIKTKMINDINSMAIVRYFGVQMDLCIPNPCLQICLDYGEYYVCECNPGYTGERALYSTGMTTNQHNIILL